ncbi:hypothetical protein D3C73_1341010 [compost metagenome]
MEATTLWIVQGLGPRVSGTCPNTQVADMEFNFLPSVDSVFERISGRVRRRRHRAGHVPNHTNMIVVTFYCHFRIHVNAGIPANRA